MYDSEVASALRQLGRADLIPAGRQPRLFRYTDLVHGVDYPVHPLWEIFSDTLWKHNYDDGALLQGQDRHRRRGGPDPPRCAADALRRHPGVGPPTPGVGRGAGPGLPDAHEHLDRPRADPRRGRAGVGRGHRGASAAGAPGGVRGRQRGVRRRAAMALQSPRPDAPGVHAAAGLQHRRPHRPDRRIHHRTRGKGARARRARPARVPGHRARTPRRPRPLRPDRARPAPVRDGAVLRRARLHHAVRAGRGPRRLHRAAQRVPGRDGGDRVPAPWHAGQIHRRRRHGRLGQHAHRRRGGRRVPGRRRRRWRCASGSPRSTPAGPPRAS